MNKKIPSLCEKQKSIDSGVSMRKYWNKYKKLDLRHYANDDTAIDDILNFSLVSFIIELYAFIFSLAV